MNNCMNYLLKLTSRGAAGSLGATESDFVIRITKFKGPNPTWLNKFKEISAFS